MKAVVTIFQFRRAVLPYLFMRHCYPVMKAAFPGAFDVWIIQDTGLAKGNIHTSSTVYTPPCHTAGGTGLHFIHDFKVRTEMH
jgi:hypothetical protein